MRFSGCREQVAARREQRSRHAGRGRLLRDIGREQDSTYTYVLKLPLLPTSWACPQDPARYAHSERRWVYIKTSIIFMILPILCTIHLDCFNHIIFYLDYLHPIALNLKTALRRRDKTQIFSNQTA